MLTSYEDTSGNSLTYGYDDTDRVDERVGHAERVELQL